MNRRVAVTITGLSWGDEGKGSVADFLARKNSATLVIRHNGGAQAAHRVVLPDGREHVFSQWGSGTFAGARTFLSHHMVTHPIAMLNEARHLQAMGIPNPYDMVTVSPRARVATPYHQEMNRIREIVRDLTAGPSGGRHGSCFTGDTEVRLLNGTSRTFRELTENSRDTPFWVYSCTPDGAVKPGLAHSPRKTGTRPVIGVTLDNGETIKCTDDHKIMMRNGEFTEAGRLVPGDSLMPLYTQLEHPYPNGPKYEQTFIPGTGEWVFTHRLVHPECASGNVRHHKDFNRFNNSPDNIKEMGWVAHQKLHQARGVSVAEWMKDPKNRERLKQIARDNGNGQRGAPFLVAYNRSAKGREKTSEMGRKFGPKNLLAYNRSEQGRKTSSLIGKKFGHIALGNFNKDPKFRNVGNHRRYQHVGEIKDCNTCRPNNHKVISIQKLGIEDVYDLTVEEHHNFALTSGVFVHNCGLGIGEAVVDAHKGYALTWADLTNYALTRTKLRMIRDEKMTEAADLGIDPALTVSRLRAIDFDRAVELMQLTARVIVAERDEERILSKHQSVIFEGAQGVLLDQDFGTQPYTTWSHCTDTNAMQMLAGTDFEATRIGVVRAYATRHGPGPFPTFDQALTDALPDPTNGFNEWQRDFRCGWFDVALTKYAIECNGGIDALAVTNLDRWAQDNVRVLRDPRTLAQNHVDDISYVTGAKVGITSHGPTWQDKRLPADAVITLAS